ncbi:MAG: tRNA lysidine(34) synthetase TilS [Rubricoccaceae bacterium]
MASFQDRLASSVRELCGNALGPVAVAVSGGVDSVVLLRSLRQLGMDVIALHVDHGLRDDSGADAAFVGELAAELDIPFERLRVTVAAGNRQHEARVARYAALAQAAQRRGCAAVATGHTATDQAETVLMHLIRGSGLRGLAGMEARRPMTRRVELVRPLLWATREEVEGEAKRHGWAWREDSSNATDVYRRNRLRHHVLPLLEAEGGPGTIRRIAASARAAREALPDLNAFVLPNELALNLGALRTAPNREAVWVEALAAWAPEVRRTTDLLRQLNGLVDGQVGRRVPVGALQAWRDRYAIRFVPPAEPVEAQVSMGSTVQTPLGAFELTAPWFAHEMPPSSGATCYELLRPEALDGELCLRTWRRGDRMSPSWLNGTKLVSDLLTERRVRPSERDRQLVLCVDDRIAWVVGHRVAEWARYLSASERFVRASWDPRDSADWDGRHP